MTLKTKRFIFKFSAQLSARADPVPALYVFIVRRDAVYTVSFQGTSHDSQTATGIIFRVRPVALAPRPGRTPCPHCTFSPPAATRCALMPRGPASPPSLHGHPTFKRIPANNFFAIHRTNSARRLMFNFRAQSSPSADPVPALYVFVARCDAVYSVSCQGAPHGLRTATGILFRVRSVV